VSPAVNKTMSSAVNKTVSPAVNKTVSPAESLICFYIINRHDEISIESTNQLVVTILKNLCCYKRSQWFNNQT
jgi:hypothetical protein